MVNAEKELVRCYGAGIVVKAILSSSNEVSGKLFKKQEAYS